MSMPELTLHAFPPPFHAIPVKAYNDVRVEGETDHMSERRELRKIDDL
jgi:hypothetical protein